METKINPPSIKWRSGLLPLNAKEGEYLLASLGDFGEMWFNIGYWYDAFFDAGTLDQDEVVAYAYLGAQQLTIQNLDFIALDGIRLVQ